MRWPQQKSTRSRETWHPWFAWSARYIPDAGVMVWLEWLERREVTEYFGFAGTECHWDYRLPPAKESLR